MTRLKFHPGYVNVYEMLSIAHEFYTIFLISSKATAYSENLSTMSSATNYLLWMPNETTVFFSSVNVQFVRLLWPISWLVHKHFAYTLNGTYCQLSTAKMQTVKYTLHRIFCTLHVTTLYRSELILRLKSRKIYQWVFVKLFWVLTGILCKFSCVTFLNSFIL